MCALRRKNIQIRDCPIPPPIVYGSSPFMIAFWKGSSLRSSQPASVSWSVRVLLRLHGYPWKKAPEQCPEPDNIQGYRRSVPSHRSPVHVRHDARHCSKVLPTCIRKTAPFALTILYSRSFGVQIRIHVYQFLGGNKGRFLLEGSLQYNHTVQPCISLFCGVRL